MLLEEFFSSFVVHIRAEQLRGFFLMFYPKLLFFFVLKQA